MSVYYCFYAFSLFSEIRENSFRCHDLKLEKGVDAVHGGAQVPRRSVHLERPRQKRSGPHRRGKTSRSTAASSA